MEANNNSTVYRCDENCCFTNSDYNGNSIEIPDENKATLIISSCIILDENCNLATKIHSSPDKVELSDLDITIKPIFIKDESSNDVPKPSDNKNINHTKRRGKKVTYFYNGAMSPVFNSCIWINKDLIPVHLKNNPFISFNVCSINDSLKRCNFNEKGVLEIKNCFIFLKRKPDKKAIRVANTVAEIASKITAAVDSDGGSDFDFTM